MGFKLHLDYRIWIVNKKKRAAPFRQGDRPDPKDRTSSVGYSQISSVIIRKTLNFFLGLSKKVAAHPTMKDEPLLEGL